ncbi:helix-turn-helix domain-containing protein [Pseudobutyrivibrio xylanivorans]|uniref:DNA-binding transcriptional regulator, XRE-family HTH domain n=1 Tax=Pseudobutyrivibrio xylanivorans DSM 14809 TaxID=1123012 RepID=A0A1M6K0H2_PSEXY|nr:helix-turn-helix transcriptional regulator [Pseudobutyrivibrio xylanivorans]SHJ52388.1 DNA-binding transcriptional regulator, XRE-family HTH domain [Pseudobutyrivibrio xylanivorans DSM 14809]
MQENYGDKIKAYRLNMGLTQNQVASELKVTPGYISNVENGRTAMSLRLLIYYAKLMGISLDALVGKLEPDYKQNAINRELLEEISKMPLDAQDKLLKTLKLWNNN